MLCFNPECLNKESYAVNNRNILLPCCYVDNAGLEDKKLLEDLIKVSDIDDHDSIDDIVNQKEWKLFFQAVLDAKKTNNLRDLPHACFKSCMRNEPIRKENWQDLD